MQRLAAAIPEEHKRAGDGGDEPEQHVDQVDPNRILAPLGAAVALRVLVDVDIAKGAEDGGPENTACCANSSAKSGYVSS